MILGENQKFASPGEALAHFGTKGMRWGVRNERELVGRSSKAGDPVSIGIGIIWAGIFLAQTVKAVRNYNVAKDDSGKKIQSQNASVPWKKNPALAKQPMSIDQLHANVVTPINPRFPAPGTKMNCRRATFAYEMRRRGNDVKATPSIWATGQDTEGLKTATMNFGGRPQAPKTNQSGWGENRIATPTRFASDISPTRKSELIYTALSKHPNGARGELAVGWNFGGGHSVAWEVVNGKAVIFDTQSAKIYKEPKSFDEFSKVVHDAAYTRTDNLKLDEAFLRRWMVNA